MILKNKKGVEMVTSRVIKLVLVALIIVMVLAVPTKAFQPIKERISGWFDWIGSLFGVQQEVVYDGLIKEAVILGVEREILLDDDGWCVVELGDEEGDEMYALNFNDNDVPYERKTEVYEVMQQINPQRVSSSIYLSYFDYLGVWKWSFDEKHWMDLDKDVFSTGQLKGEFLGITTGGRNDEELDDFGKSVVSSLNGKNLKQGSDILKGLENTRLENKNRWLSFENEIPNMERTLFRIKRPTSPFFLIFEYDNEWKWDIGETSGRWFNSVNRYSISQINELSVEYLGQKTSLKQLIGDYYINVANSLNELNFVDGENILMANTNLQEPLMKGWRDGSHGEVIWTKQIKDVLDEVCK